MFSRQTADPKIDKAIQALQSHRIEDAVQLLNKACQKNKHDLRPWLMLSSAYGQKGEIQEAIRCAKQVLKIYPNHSGALNNLGNAYSLLNNPQEAAQYYQAALQQTQGDPNILFNLGNALMRTGERVKALACFRQANSTSPDNPKIHVTLAEALLEGGETSVAISHFNAALQLMPGLPQANRGLGKAYLILGKLSLAEKHYNEAIAAGDAHPATFSGYAFTLNHLGQAEKAIDTIDKAIALNPGQPNLLQAKAKLLEQHGRYEEAFRLLSDLEKVGALDPTGACALTRISKRFNFSDKALKIVDDLLGQPSILPIYRKKLYFAAAHLLDELGRYDAAFEYFRKANDTIKLNFDYDKFHQYIDKIIATFSSERMSTLPRATNADSRPIFIVGMPRSGTTLVEQILASHPNIHGGGERCEIPDLIGRLCSAGDNSYLKSLPDKQPEDLESLASECLHQLKSVDPEATRITDKLPENFLHLGLIRLLFPMATIIHCKRHPFDTCLSIYFQDFTWSHCYASDFEDIGRYYLEYDRLMHHWEQTLGASIFTIQYEDLVADQEKQSRSILHHCGIDWDGRCMDFHEHQRIVMTASYNQVRRKIYTTSVGRWRNYEPYIFPLRNILSTLGRDLPG